MPCGADLLVERNTTVKSLPEWQELKLGVILSNRQKLQRVLRTLGLLGAAENVRYLITVAATYRKSRLFQSQNPDFKVPPRALAYDAYSAPDWDFYKTSGGET